MLVKEYIERRWEDNCLLAKVKAQEKLGDLAFMITGRTREADTPVGFRHKQYTVARRVTGIQEKDSMKKKRPVYTLGSAGESLPLPQNPKNCLGANKRQRTQPCSQP